MTLDSDRMARNDLLVYAHVGDLHLTDQDQENYRDFESIVEELSGPLSGAFDFVYLPGDNADNGRSEQYALAKRLLDRLPMPVHIVTGDHDMEPGSLDNFYASLDAATLPKAVDVGGVRCLFLDLCGTGDGGPDFRVGPKQNEWLERELKQAADNSRRCAIFMHTYPADLKGDNETSAMNEAFKAHEVLLVDMGHTHYNEIANDGRTIFTATRSTGQIEEGTVGYSIVTIDRRTVSWRFRKLGETLPIVLITAPADRRLVTDDADGDHLPSRACELRVSVLGPRPILRCAYSVDGGLLAPMQSLGGNRYCATVPVGNDAHKILVEAEDESGAIGRETVDVATKSDLAIARHADGSDADAIGAWEERGIFGTQLGPNRNGRKW